MLFCRKTHDSDWWTRLSQTKCSKTHRITSTVYTVSQTTLHLWLAIIFTCTVRLPQFLTPMLPRKQTIKMYFTFPPHLTSASVLPGETENPEIAYFHLNAAWVFTKKNTKHVSPGQSLTTLHCQNDRLDAPDRTWEGSIASCCVTHMLCVSQVCHAVSRCVKDGSCSSSSLE